MCVDFRNINKACPDDCYPLLRIDQLVDTTFGHEVLGLIKACNGYNQIKMAEKYVSHTILYVDIDIYHYIVMPFGLINAGTTYQRMVNKLFTDMIGDLCQ